MTETLADTDALAPVQGRQVFAGEARMKLWPIIFTSTLIFPAFAWAEGMRADGMVGGSVVKQAGVCQRADALELTRDLPAIA